MNEITVFLTLMLHNSVKSKHLYRNAVHAVKIESISKSRKWSVGFLTISKQNLQKMQNSDKFDCIPHALVT